MPEIKIDPHPHKFSLWDKMDGDICLDIAGQIWRCKCGEQILLGQFDFRNANKMTMEERQLARD